MSKFHFLSNIHLSSEQFSESLAMLALSATTEDQAAKLNQADEGDPEQAKLNEIGKNCGLLITDVVGFLGNQFPNPSINKMMKLVWELIGNRVTPIGIGPKIPTIAVASMRIAGAPKSVILCPHDWLQQFAADPILQTGGLVMVGSQCIDCYNDKVNPINAAQLNIRACVWEAEYLKTVNELGELKPNSYQLEVMADYPQGIGTPSIKHLLYESKPWLGPHS